MPPTIFTTGRLSVGRCHQFIATPVCRFITTPPLSGRRHASCRYSPPMSPRRLLVLIGLPTANGFTLSSPFVAFRLMSGSDGTSSPPPATNWRHRPLVIWSPFVWVRRRWRHGLASSSVQVSPRPSFVFVVHSTPLVSTLASLLISHQLAFAAIFVMPPTACFICRWLVRLVNAATTSCLVCSRLVIIATPLSVCLVG